MKHEDVERRLFEAGAAARALSFDPVETSSPADAPPSRHRWWPFAAGVLVAAAVAIVVVAVRPGAGRDEQRAPAAAGPTTTTPASSTAGARGAGTSTQPTPRTSSAGLTRPTLSPVDLNHLRTVPPHPALHTAYPFDLYTHCGIDVVQFAGGTWRATVPVTNGLPGYVAGTLELLASDRARFIPAAGHDTGNVGVVDFVRTTSAPPAPCL